jgi:hypothetical protein
MTTSQATSILGRHGRVEKNPATHGEYVVWLGASGGVPVTTVAEARALSAKLDATDAERAAEHAPSCRCDTCEAERDEDLESPESKALLVEICAEIC